MFMRVLAISLSGLFALPVSADSPGRMCTDGVLGHKQCVRDAHFVFDVCQIIEDSATRYGLDPGFFARLIWQESRFDRNALSHANARGIAQFIPSTAKLRGLKDPYNPAAALEHSAEYLGEMSKKYGNQGLAAVGYNGGERRAEGLIAKTGGLASETVNYVQIITGLTAETWRDAPPTAHDFRLNKEKDFQNACYDLAKNRKYTKFKKPEPSIKPWGVQVAWGTTQSKAKAAFRRATQSCKGTVSKEKPDYIRVKNRIRGRKPYVMVRISRNTRNAADRLCNSLRRSGCICAVYSNR